MALKDPKSAEWKMLYAVTGAIDIAQWLLDFTGVGEGINEVADTFIGVCLGLYFQFRGVSMIKDFRRLISLVAADAAEALSLSVAPAWIADVWYIHKTVKEEWAASQADISASKEAQNGNGPQNRMIGGKVMRVPPVINKPLNSGERREPQQTPNQSLPPPLPDSPKPPIIGQ